MKKTIVISLGGSKIIPDDVNFSYISSFKRIIFSNLKNYKFVIVTGGGSLARKYISAIKKEGGSVYSQSLSGINATRANARFLSYFFGFEPKFGIPSKIRTLKKYLKKRDIVMCGGLKYKPNQTSDSTAAFIASKLGSEFVNLTDVNGLYDKDPKKHKNAKLIEEVSWKDFSTISKKVGFKPGQHFVLDESASKIIEKGKVRTYIMDGVKNFDNFLRGKKFTGTVISG